MNRKWVNLESRGSPRQQAGTIQNAWRDDSRDSRVVALTAEVISKADRQHPADQVLREVLRGRRELGTDVAARVARAVFAYYRWHGWLDDRMPFPERLGYAAELAERFARDPKQFQN